MVLPPKWYQFLVGIFASLGSVLYGYELGVIAEAVASDNFVKTFNPTANETGAVVSVFTGGAIFGAFFAGPAGDILGRKKTILLGALIFILGGGLQAGAQSLSFLYAGRANAGLGVGFLVMIVPLYQAELAHPSICGRVTALQQFMLGVGALVASWVAYGTYIGFSGLERQTVAWLIDHNRAQEGLATLAKLHAHGNETDPWVRAEFDQIQDMITFEHENETKSYAELLQSRSSFRRLFLAMAIQASVQMTGVSAIQYFSPEIFEQIGIPTNDTLKYQGTSSIIALIAQFCCILFVDYTGRRWAMIGGNLGNCVCFIIATALLAKFPPGATKNTGAEWGFIAITWIYNFSFSATNGPLSWIVPAEIFDTRTRSKAVSIATMTSFAFNTMIDQITPIALTSIGWRFYILFIVCNFTNAIFFWAFQPETAKRPLEEMHYLFNNAPWFVPAINMKDFEKHDLENRVAEMERKGSVTGHNEETG